MPECENNMASGVLGLASRTTALKQCDTLILRFTFDPRLLEMSFLTRRGQKNSVVAFLRCQGQWIDGLTVNGNGDLKRRCSKRISLKAGQNNILLVFKARKN